MKKRLYKCNNLGYNLYIIMFKGMRGTYMTGQGLPPVSPAEKRVNTMIAAAAIVVAVIFAIISWQILPESVATQPAAFSTGAPNVPKFIAVLLPFGITVFSAVSCISYRKQAWICLVGYVLNILFWVTN